MRAIENAGMLWTLPLVVLLGWPEVSWARPKQLKSTCNCQCVFKDETGKTRTTGIQRIVLGDFANCAALQGTKEQCPDNDGSFYDGKIGLCTSPSGNLDKTKGPSSPSETALPPGTASPPDAVPTNPGGTETK